MTICFTSIFPADTSRIALGQVSRYRKRNLRLISLVEKCIKGTLMCDLPTPMTKTRPDGCVASRGRYRGERQISVRVHHL